MSNIFRTAEAFGVEEIIDPRDTRSHLERFVEMAGWSDVVDAAQRSVECQRYPTVGTVPRGDQPIDQTRGARRFERRERGLRLETHDAG